MKRRRSKRPSTWRAVGPCYGLVGLGMALHFASQGTGRPRWLLTAAVTRFAIAAVARGAWFVKPAR